MRNKSIQLFIFSFMGILKLSAQQSDIYTHKLSTYDKALSLYKDKQYQSAQILFDKVKANVSEQDVQADCAYYIANCAIHLNQSNADELMEDFVKDYPTSSKQNQAYAEVAHGIARGVAVLRFENFEMAQRGVIKREEIGALIE